MYAVPSSKKGQSVKNDKDTETGTGTEQKQICKEWTFHNLIIGHTTRTCDGILSRLKGAILMGKGSRFPRYERMC